ncbi:hypothetical protein G6045_03220 [Streptomyces sp. YC504]|uniref:Uncharacterized protein n=1 Tax=Streptomyces mesophilus TaxID=1775132 RepID=A0A6G4XC16_9ACTN|nr:hypothetical protein [Streptomyces mesophilus]NGO74702.1 hypothetical protein [Streptomyces mesophilus]
MTTRTLRTSIIAATAATAIGFGAYTATGAMADQADTATAAGTVITETDGTQVFTAAPTDAEATAGVEAAAHGKRVFTKTVKLASKGHTAKVYRLGKNCFQADILFNGKKIATVNAFGKTADANLNGLHVKLTKTGQVSSWVDRAKPNPKPKPKPNPEKREHVRNDTLADGSMARVYKLSANHWQAVVSSGPGAASIGTLDANGRAASGENNGLHVVLSPDGRLTSWVDNSGAPQPAPEPKPEPTPEPDPIDPQPVPDNDQQPKPQPVPDNEQQPKPDVDTAPKPDKKPAPAPAPVAPTTDPGQVQLNPAV